MANHLAGSTSPYLLQHAENPVDWYPWGREAFDRAATEDKPVFLSVGYAACHWCHVMAHESFEDPAIAARLNERFVPIKVDREERPDVDGIYMAAVQGMTGGGGWPMSVFLTPDGRPFFAGTYFPNEPRHGMPSFRQILEAIERAWLERRNELEQVASQLAEGLRQQQALIARGGGIAQDQEATLAGAAEGPSGPRLDPTVVRQSLAGLVHDFDAANGGWGGAPKFPQAALLELLLRRGVTVRGEAMGMARKTLDAMAEGGIHDQLGGGFHRYSTDAEWLVPHFEKMLYDNAQLARVYLHAYQATGSRRYREVAEDTLDYMARELLTPEGLFAASQDADTAGVEGATYVWTRDEVAQVLAGGAPSESDDPPPVHTPEFIASATGWGDDSAPRERTQSLRPSAPAQLDELFATAYGVNELGNWEGRTILSRVRSDEEIGATYGLSPDEVAERLAAARAALFAAREERPQPARDDKAIAGWNGLALAAFADAATILGRSGYREIAERAADALLRHLRTPDGRLVRSYRAGRRTGQGMLEDYAFVAEGLLALYEATFEERWVEVARDLMATVATRFANPEGGWFDTADDHEPLLLRPRDLQDGATPSGNAATAMVLLRLSELTGEGRQRSAAERAIELVQPALPRFPLGFGEWLLALDFAVSPVVEVAIVGDPNGPDAQALIAVARRGFAPYRVVAAGDPSSSSVELVQGRFRLNGNATAFVCRQFACRQPVTEPSALAAQLPA